MELSTLTPENFFTVFRDKFFKETSFNFDPVQKLENTSFAEGWPYKNAFVIRAWWDVQPQDMVFCLYKLEDKEGGLHGLPYSEPENPEKILQLLRSEPIYVIAAHNFICNGDPHIPPFTTAAVQYWTKIVV